MAPRGSTIRMRRGVRMNMGAARQGRSNGGEGSGLRVFEWVVPGTDEIGKRFSFRVRRFLALWVEGLRPVRRCLSRFAA